MIFIDVVGPLQKSDAGYPDSGVLNPRPETTSPLSTRYAVRRPLYCALPRKLAAMFGFESRILAGGKSENSTEIENKTGIAIAIRARCRCRDHNRKRDRYWMRQWNLN
ncbi:hypothetical protein EVAR_4637_1 [Eumeta japonica]|uniref:Uncharacterized protein n=1 Tax=Eumeta variegata TaxID=151549 RepID=A0A4C1SWG1_EUMVA|nr:hypothetical protein EVAR_4637_1 [Eumeta japonica]